MVSGGRHPLRREDGMTIVEILVAATILVVVAMAVGAALVSAGQRSTQQQARSTALDVAQQEQQRLRAQALQSRAGTLADRTESIGGVPYTVRTVLRWRADGPGIDACSSAAGVSRRLEMATTVTSAFVGADAPSGRRDPVRLVTSVAPSALALQGAASTVIVKVSGAVEAEGVPGLPVTFTRAQGGTSTVTTNDAGCAVLEGASAGDYTITATRAGWVDDRNQPSASTTTTVGVGQTATATPLRYASSGSVNVTFRWLRGSSWISGQSTGASAVSGNAIGSAGPLSYRASVRLDDLFPGSGYAVRSGSCQTTSGTSTTTAVSSDSVASAVVDHGRLRFRRTSSTDWTANTNVVLRSLDPDCGTRIEGRLLANADGGSTPLGSFARTGTTDQGIPYGRWRACLQARSGTTTNFAPAVGPITVSATDQQTVLVPTPPNSGTGTFTTDEACR